MKGVLEGGKGEFLGTIIRQLATPFLRLLHNDGVDTGKAGIESFVKAAGFLHHTFVVAPFYYQNLVGAFGPQKLPDGSLGWAVPLDPDVRCLHMGDITELGKIVTGAFLHPDRAGNGEHLPLVGDFLSFNEIIETLNRQGNELSVKQVPKKLFATFFPGAAEIAEMFSYFSGSYLFRFGFEGPNCARKRNSRQATDQVFDVGSPEYTGIIASGPREVIYKHIHTP